MIERTRDGIPQRAEKKIPGKQRTLAPQQAAAESQGAGGAAAACCSLKVSVGRAGGQHLAIRALRRLFSGRPLNLPSALARISLEVGPSPG